MVTQNATNLDTIPRHFVTYPEWQGNLYGQGVFSPNGQYYAQTAGAGRGPGFDWGVQLYQYDRCTGDMQVLESRPFELWPEVDAGLGIAFSPNSRFLYFTDGFYLWQADLQNPNPLSNLDTIDFYDPFQLYLTNKDRPESTDFLSFMQLAPDGRIYILADGGEVTKVLRFYHIIEYPERKGKDCKFRPREVVLNGGTGTNSCMPNFPNYRLGPLDGSPCDTLGLNNEVAARFRYLPRSARHPLQIEFIDLSVREPKTWFWDFGDGSTSTESSLNHAFPAPGIYKVCLTVTNAFSSSTTCKMVQVQAPDAMVTGDDLRVYPNPWSEGSLNILWDFEGPDGMDCPWTLFDAIGRQIHSGVLSKKDQYPQLSQLSNAGYPNGIYFLSVYNPYRKKYASVKLVVQE